LQGSIAGLGLPLGFSAVKSQVKVLAQGKLKGLGILKCGC